MLIRKVTAQVYEPRKVVIFLTTTVPLGQQQAEFISKQTGLTVRQFAGRAQDTAGKQIDTYNHTEWKVQFDSTDVLVMTRNTTFPPTSSLLIRPLSWTLRNNIGRGILVS
jgi:ERCC4-related helicase